MTSIEVGLVALGSIGILVLGGMFIPFALMAISFLGVWAIKGSPVLAAKLLGLAANDAISNYYFGVIPVFIFMGFVVSEAGIGKDAFEVTNAILRKIKGGLGVGTVAANAVFASVTGISIASAAVFTKIAVPELRQHGYSARFSVGVVAGSSVLGMLIPPSLLLILYALLTKQSIGDLFIAGVGPGLLLAGMFALGIIAVAYCAPSYLGENIRVSEKRMTRSEMLSKGLPIAALVILVLGGIYGGIFTPVEAGAVGAIAALFIGFSARRLSGQALWRILIETGLVTASVCFLIIAAQMYSRMLAVSGLPIAFGEMAISADLGFISLILVYISILIVLGMILDSASIMMIMVPLMLPVVIPMGVDLVWFGIITVIAVEIGLLTPPFGISVYVIKSSLTDDELNLSDLFLGAAPFVLLMIACLLLVVFFPWIATGFIN